MDNVKYHQKRELRKLAREKVRFLFLPPYTPDYIPIKKSCAKIKRFLKNNMNLYQSVDSAIYDYFGIVEN